MYFYIYKKDITKDIWYKNRSCNWYVGTRDQFGTFSEADPVVMS